MQFDIQLEEDIPRKAYFKVGKSLNATILKKEMVEYMADKNELVVRNQPAMVLLLDYGILQLHYQEQPLL